jgi:hypothetical protein
VTVLVADAYVQVQMLVLVKMATVLEEFTTEEQRSVVLFLWPKGFDEKGFHK